MIALIVDVDICLERKLLARVVAGAEAEVRVGGLRRERAAARLAIVECTRVPSAPPVYKPVIFQIHMPIAVAAVGNLVAAVIPVLVFPEPHIDIARVFRRVLIDVLHDGVRRSDVGARHEAEVIEFETGRERLHLQVRTPTARLFAEHDPSAESAERSARRVVVKIGRVGSLIVVRCGELRVCDGVFASTHARRTGEPFHEPVFLMKQRVAVDAEHIRRAAQKIQIVIELAIDGREKNANARVAFVEFFRTARHHVIRQRLDLLP